MGPELLLMGNPYQAAPAAATFDPVNKSSLITLSNGNLTAARSSAAASRASVVSTTAKSAGKWYCELRIDSSPNPNYLLLGVGKSYSAMVTAGAVGVDANSYAYYQDTGQKYNNNVLAAYGTTYNGSGFTIGIALDMDTGKLWFSKNNVWQASGNPAAGTGAAYTGLSGAFYVMASLYQGPVTSDTVTAHFSAASLTYSPPTGFTAWG